MKTLKDRFFMQINTSEPDQCWEWAWAGRNGYATIKDGSKVKLVHRVAYEIFVGEIPKGMEIDHMCHNRRCVNPSHLRLCTRAENGRNRGIGSNNTSGFKGVCWATHANKWLASIRVDGILRSLGYFNSPELAHQAYMEAAAKLHGEFANFGV